MLDLYFLPIFKIFFPVLEVSILPQARVGPLWAQEQEGHLSSTVQEPAGRAPSTGLLFPETRWSLWRKETKDHKGGGSDSSLFPSPSLPPELMAVSLGGTGSLGQHLQVACLGLAEMVSPRRWKR